MNFKELLDIAKAELADLTSVDNPDFRLEQAEHDKETNVWEIVVSYLVENANRKIRPLTNLSTGFEYLRMYKALKINADKEVIGLYMFEAQR